MKIKMTFGEWITHPDGGSFKLAPYGNPKHIEEQYRRVPAPKINTKGEVLDIIEMGHETLYDSMLDNAMVLYKSIVLDWREIQDENGADIEYNEANALQILVGYADVRDWVMTESRKLAKLDPESVAKEKVVVKNSKST